MIRQFLLTLVLSYELYISGVFYVSLPFGSQRHPFPLEALMHSLCFRFPPISKKMFRLRGILSKFYLFPINFSIFLRQNFWWPFFGCWVKILSFPLFSLFQYISPTISGNFLCPLWFRKIYIFFTYFMCFSFHPSLTMMHLCITQCTHWSQQLWVQSATDCIFLSSVSSPSPPHLPTDSVWSVYSS